MKNTLQLTKAICLTIAFLLLPVIASANEQKEIESLATGEAMVFLQLIDAGKYLQSWEKTAPIFKRKVSQEKWAEMLSQVRPLFGAIVNRNIEKAIYSTALPEVPDGEYVTIQFASSFEKQTEAYETVTMMLVGKEWQVVGYFIR